MQKEFTLTSVGIDIGTTTTQLVISRLTLANIMPGSQVPKVEVTHKTVVYMGNVYFTPFLDRERVDGAGIRKIVDQEYQRAGIRPEEIQTGAIIITGETAKKENASEIIHSLADYAGDFVVATAGPDLESLIAGKGSGAEELSKKEHACIANIDIGGGTTNIAVFKSGKCLGTACLNVGGRLFEVCSLTHRLSYISPPAQKVLDHLSPSLQLNSIEEEARWVEKALETMVRAVERVILHQPLDPVDEALIMSNSLPELSIDGVVFSGGVARYIYQPGIDTWWMYGDVGPLLAEAFRKSCLFRDFKVFEASETLHATVLGAGAHTINVSGSTVAVGPNTLPLRNLPAIYPEIDSLTQEFVWHKNAESFVQGLYKTLALIVPPLPDTNFATISACAENLASELKRIDGLPKVVITQQDIAKVLGQSLRKHLGNIPLVCLDGIELFLGDFIDIGKPLPYEEAVPVIVKTLVFAR